MAEGFRRYHRYQIIGEAVIIPRRESGLKPISSQVNNISQGGIGIYTDVPLEMSSEVRVKLLFLEDNLRGEENLLNGRVAFLSKNDDQYFLGISFDHAITYELFMKMINWY